MTNRLLGLLFATPLVVFGLTAYGCGSTPSADAGDGGADGSLDGTGTTDDGGPTGYGNDGGWNGNVSDGAPGTCRPLGQACSGAGDCCSGDCLGGSCQPAKCVSDGLACANAVDCCSGTCAGGKCAALNTTCRTLGNTCSTAGDCCSKLCSGGICAQPSFCGQNGDVCRVPTDCCGGVCTVAAGATFGTCAQPPGTGAQCSMVDGVVCSGVGADGGVVLTDGGVPACGGDCCSRSCAPWGPTGVLVCQPASGCHPVGDVCRKDSDCCGGPGVPGPLPSSGKTAVCNITAPNIVGVCENPQGCKPNGDVCRLKTNSCNATDECCSGNVQQNDTCKQDVLGVPRCSNATCGQAGAACATSGDCCNGNPCVPNPAGTPPFVCAATTCQPAAGSCTTNADCCPGNICNIPIGSTSGSCASDLPPPPDAGSTGDSGTGNDSGSTGTDGGTPVCSLYGQTCTTASDCCDGVPCTSGRCLFPVR